MAYTLMAIVGKNEERVIHTHKKDAHTSNEMHFRMNLIRRCKSALAVGE